MSKILVVADHKSGSLKDSTKELLGFASGLGAELSAIVIGSGVSSVADEEERKKTHQKIQTATAKAKGVITFLQMAEK